MSKIITGTLVLSLLAGAPAVAASNDVTLKTGASQVIHINDVNRIAVGDKKIIGVLPLPGKSEILINARESGRTSLIIWTGPGLGVEHDYQVVVTADDLEILSSMLRSTIARNDVKVETFGKSIVVSGKVNDGAALQQVSDVLMKFEPISKADGASVVNAVVLDHPFGAVEKGITGNSGMAGVRIDPDGQGNVIVSGHVKDEMQRQSALSTIRIQAGRFLAAKGEIIDRLAMDDVTQINIKVRVLSIDDTGLSQLGLRLQSFDGKNFGPSQFPITENTGKNFAGALLGLGPFFRTIALAPTLDLIQNNGHAKTLSEPNLTTIPGELATFLVGGQIPVPSLAGTGGQVSVQYQNYGVQLNVTPKLLPNGDILTKINPEISDLDFSNGVQISGFLIPALKTSKLSTTVVTSPGDSIVMGGMLRQVETRTIEKIPFFSSLPFIGKLFQDTRYQHGETHVIFVMTPQIISKSNQNQYPGEFPANNLASPSAFNPQP